MTEQTVSRVRLGDYLDHAVDQALALLRQRNPGLQWDREQLIRLSVGYGLTRLFRQHDRVVLNLKGWYRHLGPASARHLLVTANLSHGGIGFHTLEDHAIRVNEVLLVELPLEPGEGSTGSLSAHVLVKHVNGRGVGAAFVEPRLSDAIERLLVQVRPDQDQPFPAESQAPRSDEVRPADRRDVPIVRTPSVP